MQFYESKNFIVIAFVTWVAFLFGFSLFTGSAWSWPLAILLLSFCVKVESSTRILSLTLAVVTLIFCFIRFEFAKIETRELLASTKNPTLFEIASDPQEFSTFSGATYSLSANVKSSKGELLVRLSHPILENAQISSIWQCDMSFENAPLNKRYRALAECHDLPLMVRGQNNMQHFGDAFRSTLQGLTSGRNESLGAQLLPGLVVGDTSRQTSYLEDTLRESGLGHLTAVSGANVAILLIAIGLVLDRTRLTKAYRLLILLSVLGAYLVIVRPEPSVVRASVMALVALGYWFLGLQKHGEKILLISVSILLFIDPWLSLSWGFALSASATFGLIVLPRIFGINSTDHWLRKSLGVALAAGIATFPVLVAMGAAPTFASILANVLAEAFVAPATILGLVSAVIGSLEGVLLLGFFFDIIAMFLADAAIACAQIICWIAEFALRSWIHIPVLSSAGVLLSVLFILIWRRQTSQHLKRLSLVGVVVIVVISNISPVINSQWTLASCDVGQGDSTLIRTGQHSAVVVDTGNSPDLLQQCLQSFQIDSVETLVITHMHEDHFGAFETLKSFNPQKVIIPTAYVTNDILRRLHEVFADVVIAEPGYSEHHTFGQWAIVQVGEEQGDSGTDINNSGVVLFIDAEGVRALLLADIEIEAQARLLSIVPQWNIDIVKIAHHGSRYQHPELAKMVSAPFGWISVGRDNSYSHPHPEMITLYTSLGTKLFSTADCGHIYLVSASREILTSRVCEAL